MLLTADDPMKTAVHDNFLDHVTWHALGQMQKHLSIGTASARRYAPGLPPIIAFADPARADFAALAPYCQPGEHFYCDGWTGAPPAGWQIDLDSSMFRMVWDRALPARDEAPEAVRLGPEHVSDALELTELTHPGPFGPRNLELGEYFGYFEGERLIAMAGERMQAGQLREISGVCTHPDFQGRGHARRLMLKLIRRQMLRGEVPFLHVMRDNVGAHALYERMGFVDYRECVVRVVSLA
ncbi:MAG TPA: GNAT family N-acetyltransferase [Burkholderiaceae bacterium]|nr:GNAT family N-acetyltransferase [Burkholderiaceae bacterium]